MGNHVKIRIETQIYGTLPQLNLGVKILYGKNDQYEQKVFRKLFSLDKGGKVELPLNFLADYANSHIEEKFRDAE